MRYTLSVVAIFLFFSGVAQVSVDTSIKLDLLKAPASPAFNILGIATSDIERPTDITSFSLSLQEATNNFTSIPKSYAFQVAPFLLGNRKYTLSEFDSSRFGFKQSFLVSAGFTHKGPDGLEDVDSLKTTKLGLGIKFSILRPGWSAATRTSYKNLIAQQQKLSAEYQMLEKQHKKFDTLFTLREERRALNNKNPKTPADQSRIQVLINEMSRLEGEINEDLNEKIASSSVTYEAAKKAALELKNERQGAFLDFSSGFAFDFPNNRLGEGKVYRGGLWLTGGYEGGNSGITSLFIARYLYNPESVFADPNGVLKEENLSTFDAGTRLLLNVGKGKFVFSGEALYRSVFGNSEIDPSWRLVFNTEYDVGMNKKLTFSFGRDFDGTISKGGNLVAALNLILGFGSERTPR